MTEHIAVPIPEVHRYSLVILRLAQVKARTGRSRSSIYADIKAGRFITPINIGPRAVGWLAHEVDEWITARITESRGGAKCLPTK